MSMNITPKFDYSGIISGSLSSQKKRTPADMSSLTRTVLNGGGDTTLTDYASIKNGSYGKLLRAYYSEVETYKKGDSSADSKKADTKKADTKKAESEKTTDKKTASKTTSGKTKKEDVSLSSLLDISI